MLIVCFGVVQVWKSEGIQVFTDTAKKTNQRKLEDWRCQEGKQGGAFVANYHMQRSQIGGESHPKNTHLLAWRAKIRSNSCFSTTNFKPSKEWSFEKIINFTVDVNSSELLTRKRSFADIRAMSGFQHRRTWHLKITAERRGILNSKKSGFLFLGEIQ